MGSHCKWLEQRPQKISYKPLLSGSVLTSLTLLWIGVLVFQVASLQAELTMMQTQLTDRNTHLLQQQRMTMAFGAQGTQAVEFLQPQHLADHSQLSSTSGLSMGIPGGSSTGPYTRVKAEDSYLHGMQTHLYDVGMPATSMEPTIMSTEHSLLESMQRFRSGGMAEQSDEGELQALTSLFRRK